jgi:hypothetical protein
MPRITAFCYINREKSGLAQFGCNIGLIRILPTTGDQDLLDILMYTGKGDIA